MNSIGKHPFKLSEQLIAELKDLGMRDTKMGKGLEESSAGDKGPSFLDHLKDGVSQVNDIQKESDQMATDLATGKQENLHETMLKMSQAELSFNLMVQVRNKVLEAYQEVMRMPV